MIKEKRKVLSPSEIGIPSLSAFGLAEGTGALLPVLEHRHHGKYEFAVVTDGMQRYSVCSNEETVYACEALIVRPDEEHICLAEQDGWSRIYWIQLDALESTDFLGLSGKEAALVKSVIRSDQSRKLRISQTTISRLADAFSLLGADVPIQKLEGRKLLTCAMLEILTSQGITQTLSPQVDAAKRYILSHIADAIDLDEVSLKCGISNRELAKQFERELHCSVRDYILKRKIQACAKELAVLTKSEADIVYRYHFSSVSFFRIRFKQEMGMSVRQYRKKLRQKHKKTFSVRSDDIDFD